MKVKMLVTESGRHTDWPTDNGQYHCVVGSEHDAPTALAKAWIAAGVAERVRTKKTKKSEE